MDLKTNMHVCTNSHIFLRIQFRNKRPLPIENYFLRYCIYYREYFNCYIYIYICAFLYLQIAHINTHKNPVSLDHVNFK